MQKVLCFGEPLMRLSPPGHQRFRQAQHFQVLFGGAELNTAVSLALLGLPVGYVSCIPNHDLSEALLQYLHSFQIDTTFIQRHGNRLGLYFLEQGALSRSSKVIYDREASALACMPPQLIQWEETLANCSWLHITGITPAISASAAATTLSAVQTACKMGKTVSIDLNYRSSLWQYGAAPSSVMPDILQHVHVMLGDLDTVDTYFGINSKAASETKKYEEVLALVHQRFPLLQHICFSYRRQHSASNNCIGAWYSNQKNVFAATEVALDGMIDRLGSGDAMMAGLIYALHNYQHDMQQGLHFAVAAAAIKASIPGDANLATKSEILAAMNGNNGRIIR